MEPTLIGDATNSDQILSNMLIYNFQKPQRGDIVILKSDGKTSVKRLAGLPGELIYIKENSLFINNKKIENPLYFKNAKYYFSKESMNYGDPSKPIKIPDDNYFVLGDNTENSKDSRYYGFVHSKNIIGKAICIYFPLNRAKKL